MAESTLWWLLDRPAVAVELVTGTFYLLMVAIGLAAAAIAAHMGAGLTAQLVVAAVVGGGRVPAGTNMRPQARPQARWPAAANRDVNLDIGETVQVDQLAARRHGHRQIPGRQLDGGPPQRACARPPAPTASSKSSEAAWWWTRSRNGACRPPAPSPFIHPRKHPMEIASILIVIALIFIVRAIRIVPQQHAWVVERLGKYHGTLTPGLNILVPFIDRVAYKHSLKEIPLDIPSQVCITRDNTQLQVDGILYFQVTDAMRASYGSSNYIVAIDTIGPDLRCAA